MNKFEAIKALVADLETESDKFYNKQNKAAGTRLRSGLQQLKVLAQQGRTEITDLKKASN